MVNNIPSSEQVSAFGDFKHYFGELNENEKRAYNAILRDIESFPEEIEIPELNNEELEKVWLAVMYDTPELIMLGRECMLVSRDRKFWFSCEYAMTKDEYEQKKAELQAKADELGAKIVKETSDFDKELLIHDAIIDSCRYTDSDKLVASSAYGVLVNGSASCEGYAKAAKLLLDKAGIENYVITGTAKREDGASEGHMWNVVFIDGKPYNLDLTWDDPIGEGVTQNKRYAYFNITDEEILKTHTFSDASACCTATDSNYFVNLGRQFDGYNAETKTALSNMFGGHKSGDKLDVRFSSEDAYQRAIDGLLKKEEIYRLLSIADAGKYYADFFEDFDERRYEEALQRMELNPKDKIRTLSSGMNAKVRLALTLSRDAQVMMFDEPLNGVDILPRKQVVDEIIRNRENGRTMIISTHLVDELNAYIDVAIFMKNGVLERIGDRAALEEKHGSLTNLYLSIYGGKEEEKHAEAAQV